MFLNTSQLRTPRIVTRLSVYCNFALFLMMPELTMTASLMHNVPSPSSANIFNITLVFTTFTIQKHFIFNTAKIVKILRYFAWPEKSYEQNYEHRVKSLSFRAFSTSPLIRNIILLPVSLVQPKVLRHGTISDKASVNPIMSSLVQPDNPPLQIATLFPSIGNIMSLSRQNI